MTNHFTMAATSTLTQTLRKTFISETFPSHGAAAREGCDGMSCNGFTAVADNRPSHSVCTTLETGVVYQPRCKAIRHGCPVDKAGACRTLRADLRAIPFVMSRCVSHCLCRIAKRVGGVLRGALPQTSRGK